MRLPKTKKPQRSWPCNKIRYRDDLAAKAALRTFRAARKRDPDHRYPVRAYRCQVCRGWHLTSIEVWVDWKA